MAVYIFGQAKQYEIAGLDYAQTYRQKMLKEISQPVRYLFTELPEQRDLELYGRAGIPAEQLLGIYPYLSHNGILSASIKVKEKLC